MKAVQAAFVEIKTPKFTKKVGSCKSDKTSLKTLRSSEHMVFLCNAYAQMANSIERGCMSLNL